MLLSKLTAKFCQCVQCSFNPRFLCVALTDGLYAMASTAWLRKLCCRGDILILLTWQVLFVFAHHLFDLSKLIVLASNDNGFKVICIICFCYWLIQFRFAIQDNVQYTTALAMLSCIISYGNCFLNGRWRTNQSVSATHKNLGLKQHCDTDRTWLQFWKLLLVLESKIVI